MIYRSYSAAETRKFASKLAKKLVRGSVKKKTALVVALSGELGSGKTTFVQGFLRGLGIRKRTTSPTFILFRRFRLGHKFRDSRLGFRDLFHIDAYRIKEPRELLSLGIKEIFSDPKNIVLVEWADKIRQLLPKGAIRIRFFHGRHENERKIVAI
ncbi:MAG: tRNA (adenosine(37)-N6)-threonylcarbamoyltransferase complex ATPase subunit type 1 TsaE [Patescibacteria group bacterium]